MMTLANYLLETFDATFTPNDEELHAFTSLAKPFKLSSKQALPCDDHVFDKIFFLMHGIVRSFLIYKGKEHTIEFYTKQQFVLDWESFDQSIPSRFRFESLSNDTMGYYWDRKDYLDFMDRYNHFKKSRRMLAESAYMRNVERLMTFQSDNLSARYQKLLQCHGNLIDIIPQYHIASYLGVKPQSLSRTKKELNFKNIKAEDS